MTAARSVLPRDVTPADMKTALGKRTERDFQAAVIQLAKVLGFMVFHTYDSRRSPSGFPDLVLAKSGRVLFVELKAQGGKTTKAQDAWLAELDLCAGVDVYLWRPSDWDEIKRVLGAKRA